MSLLTELAASHSTENIEEPEKVAHGDQLCIAYRRPSSTSALARFRAAMREAGFR